MLTVSGHSHDGIMVEGDLVEEFDAVKCDDGLLAFSDGTILKVEYDEYGLWRFKVLYKGDLYNYKVEGDLGNDADDEVHFNDGVIWVAFSKNMQLAI
ncbi:MAG: hypothetical protein AB7E31_14665 [Desulfitobacterium sp.]